MKVAVMVNKANFDRYSMPEDIPPDWQLVHLGNGETDVDRVVATGADALLVDPVRIIPAEIINSLPRLKLIQSQGVGYNLIDLAAAKNRGVYVCNNAGVNAVSVAEQAVLLMLVLLRHFREFEDMVYAARQAEAKTRCFASGLTELSECHVGIIGMGAIGKETARILKAFGSRVSYFSRREVPDCGVPWLSLDDLYAQCDIVSLHVPVTPETTGMINEAVINKMKPGAILINTARGELLDQEAVCRALAGGRLGGVGVDTLAPEPVRPDNPFLALPEEIRKKVALSPHIGGITAGSFYRAYKCVWRNMRIVAAGGRPVNIVNGL